MSVMTPTSAERQEFAPPPTPGSASAFILALVVHALLVAALTFSVQWKDKTDTPAIEAEIWSAVPALAAPKLQAPPEPEPAPEPQPVTPKPRPVVAPPPPAPAAIPEVNDAAIALERKKKHDKQQAIERAETLAQQEKIKKRETEKKEQAEALAKEKLAQEKQEKQEKSAQLALANKQAEKEKAKKREAEERLENERQAKADKAAKAEKAAKADKAKDALAAKEADARHEAQVKKILGMAGASGDANATGTAKQSSGPSAAYGARIGAVIKRNIVFPDDIPGNPTAEVEFHTSPDGSIVGTPKLKKSSGFKAWDDAVMSAILKTETLPKDTDGRIPPVILMEFKLKDLSH